jgi:hypothetical protein
MANTFVKIASVTVGAGGASSINFTSIPQNLTDLVLKTSIRTSYGSVNDAAFITFNGTTSGYSTLSVYGNGISAGSETNPYGATNKTYIGTIDTAANTASTFTSTDTYIPNYTSSNFKSLSSNSVSEQNSTDIYMALSEGLFSNTAAITSLSISFAAGNFVQYTTATLYGISKS